MSVINQIASEMESLQKQADQLEREYSNNEVSFRLYQNRRAFILEKAMKLETKAKYLGAGNVSVLKLPNGKVMLFVNIQPSDVRSLVKITQPEVDINKIKVKNLPTLTPLSLEELTGE